MRIFNLTSIIFAATVLFSCSTPKTESEIIDDHNSQNSLDWEGSYRGDLKLNDIQSAEIDLKSDNSYTLKVKNNEDESVKIYKGKAQWDKAGSNIKLDQSPVGEISLKVGENTLIQNENNRLDKNFQDKNIIGIHWNLIEINEEKLKIADKQLSPYIILHGSFGDVNGNLGCNTFFGSYSVPVDGQISFGRMGITMMACPDMSIENKFNQNLEKVAFYTVSDNQLQLISENQKVILKFEKAQK